MRNFADLHAGARKRGLCPYDDKRYLLADLPDGLPNPNTHAYGHYELQTEERLHVDMPERPGTELVIEQRQPRQEAKAPQKTEEVEEPYYTSLLVVKRELRFKRKHARVEKTLAKRTRRDSNGEDISGDEYEPVPGDDENGELSGAQLRKAERAAAARPGAAIRIGDVIERICARGNMQLPTSPPRRMPPPSSQRAGIFNDLNPDYGLVTYLSFSHRTQWSEPTACEHFRSPDHLLLR